MKRSSMTPILTTAASISALLLSMVGTTQVQAHTSQKNTERDRVINISAKASKLVANDEIYATLYIEEQNTNSAKLARSLTNTMNSALAQAKSYSAVKTNTGSQSTYPMYYKNGKIRGWQGRAAIELRSKDFEQAGKLIADLQQSLKLEQVNFRVSGETREQVETQLMQEASKSFQSRAQSLLNVWNASGYQLINLNLNTSGSHHQPVYAARAEMAIADNASMPAQNFSGGESRITVTANGSIQLK